MDDDGATVVGGLILLEPAVSDRGIRVEEPDGAAMVGWCDDGRRRDEQPDSLPEPCQPSAMDGSCTRLEAIARRVERTHPLDRNRLVCTRIQAPSLPGFFVRMEQQRGSSEPGVYRPMQQFDS